MWLPCVQRKHEAGGREETDHADRDGNSGRLAHAHMPQSYAELFVDGGMTQV
jgi:hypothetical protein